MSFPSLKDQQPPLGPGESIEYIKHRVRLEGHPWPGYHPKSDTWCPYTYGQTSKEGLEQCWSSEPKKIAI